MARKLRLKIRASATQAGANQPYVLMFVIPLAATSGQTIDWIGMFPWPTTVAVVVFFLSLALVNESVRLSIEPGATFMVRLGRNAPLFLSVVLAVSISYVWVEILARNHILSLRHDFIDDFFRFAVDYPDGLVPVLIAASAAPTVYSSYKLILIFMSSRAGADAGDDRPIAARAILGLAFTVLNLLGSVAALSSHHLSKWMAAHGG